MSSRSQRRRRDDLLVSLIAQGDLTTRQIAERVGLSPSMVSRIARGKRRKDLHARVDSAVTDESEQARRLGLRYLGPLLTKHIKHGLEGDDETARKCREYALSKFLAPPEEPQPAALAAPMLTAADYDAIAKLKGGPGRPSPKRLVEPER